MLICPQCRKKIDYLINYRKGWKVSEMRLSDDGLIDYEGIAFRQSDNSEFCCPNCDGTLFLSEQEAVVFLTSKNK